MFYRVVCVTNGDATRVTSWNCLAFVVMAASRKVFCNGNRVSFPGVKWAWRGVNHPPSFSSGVKERVELYLYSPLGPSWPVLSGTLHLLSVLPFLM